MSDLSLPCVASLIIDAGSTHAFAEISGDYNPLHVDPVAARRLLFGSTVAHGIHVLLGALEKWADAVIPGERWGLSSLDVRFDRPVPTGCEALFQIKPPEDGQTLLTIMVENQIAVRLKFRCCLNPGHEDGLDYLPGNPEPGPARMLPLNEATRESGRVPLHLELSSLGHLLPGLAARFSSGQLSRLLATTRLVGMVYPGLHSIYSRLSFDFSPESKRNDQLHYEVTQLDSRFCSATLRIHSGGASGEILSFFRPEPCLQAGAKSLRTYVGPSEFSGQRALIVGGSRGLGEATAKILATGGAQVLLTYSRGEEDARRIVDEISQQGGSARYLQWDARHPQDKSKTFWDIDGESPTHLYYFATPKIATGKKGHFSPALFRDFCDFYLTALSGLIEQFPALSGLFYPSTVFVADVPANLAEYAAAKAAGESLCRFYGRTRLSLSVLCPRLPRLATDQTLSLMGSPAPDPDPVQFLLPQLRDLHKATNHRGEDIS